MGKKLGELWRDAVRKFSSDPLQGKIANKFIKLILILLSYMANRIIAIAITLCGSPHTKASAKRGKTLGGCIQGGKV
jgi:hypothetical protein